MVVTRLLIPLTSRPLTRLGLLIDVMNAISGTDS